MSLLQLVTPPLDGTILPGVTRDSILALCRSWGTMDVCERPISVGDLRAAFAAGRVLEMFGSGTACVVQPVSALVQSDGSRLSVPGYNPADPQCLTSRLTQALMDIQYGRADKTQWREWSVVV